jgi:hypothetical protein
MENTGDGQGDWWVGLQYAPDRSASVRAEVRRSPMRKPRQDAMAVDDIAELAAALSESKRLCSPKIINT